MPPEQAIVLEFARILATGDFEAAQALCARAYTTKYTAQHLRKSFNQIIADDSGPVSVEVLEDVLTDWPGKQPQDIGWMYASLEGEVYPYSEGLYVLVTREDGVLRVGNVTFGRP